MPKGPESKIEKELRLYMESRGGMFPKSVSLDRLRENGDVFDFTLDDDAHARIAGLDTGERTGRQFVVDREGEHRAGARAADVADGDVHLERHRCLRIERQPHDGAVVDLRRRRPGAARARAADRRG